MEGGTTFHFVTDGIDSALERATDAAQGQDVRVGGGPRRSASTWPQASSTNSTSRSHPRCWAPAKRCWPGIDLPALGYHAPNTSASPYAMHVVLTRSARTIA